MGKKIKNLSHNMQKWLQGCEPDSWKETYKKIEDPNLLVEFLLSFDVPEKKILDNLSDYLRSLYFRFEKISIPFTELFEPNLETYIPEPLYKVRSRCKEIGAIGNYYVAISHLLIAKDYLNVDAKRHLREQIADTVRYIKFTEWSLDFYSHAFCDAIRKGIEIED